MRIGMFDSGIGGLTVLKSFLKYHPNNEYIYYGDTLNVPYGNKSKEELFNLSKKIIEYLESKKVDIIVIACGTVSSNLYDELIKISSVPIYSIISELKEYVEEKKYNSLLVMATSATIDTHIFKKMLSIDVKEVPCPKLVPLIEENKDKELDEVLKEYLNGVNGYDAIVLGCTHYPLVKDKIKRLVDNDVDIIELGEILAKKIIVKDSYKNVELYFTKESEVINNNVEKILKA